MPKAYVYARFSSKGQKDGTSIERQQEYAAEYVAQHPELGLTLVDVKTYEDLGVNAFRGRNAQAGALNRFIGHVRDGTVESGSWLLIEDFSRLSRAGIGFTHDLIKTLNELGITIVLVRHGLTYQPGDLVNNELAWVQLVFGAKGAHGESDRKSDHLKRSRALRRQAQRDGLKKTGGRHPAWLELKENPAPEENPYREVPEKVAVVREIFNLAEAGMHRTAIWKHVHGDDAGEQKELVNQSAIAKHLNSNGTSSFDAARRHGGYQGWKQSQIRHILTSRTVLGEFQPGMYKYDGSGARHWIPEGPPIKGFYPIIIEESQFNTVQKRLSENKATNLRNAKKGGVANLFAGLLRCAICDGNISIGSGGSGNKKVHTRYCVCDNGRRKMRGVPCDSSSWRLEQVEALILQHMKGVNFRDCVERAANGPGHKSKRAQLGREKADLESRISDLNQRLEQLTLNMLHPQNPASMKERMRGMYAEHEQELGTLADKLEDVRQREDALTRSRATPKTIKKIIDELDSLPDDQKELARLALSEQIRYVVRNIYLEIDRNVRIRAALKETGMPANRVEEIIEQRGRTQHYQKGVSGKVDDREKSITMHFMDNEVRVVFENGVMRAEALGELTLAMLEAGIQNEIDELIHNQDVEEDFGYVWRDPQ